MIGNAVHVMWAGSGEEEKKSQTTGIQINATLWLSSARRMVGPGPVRCEEFDGPRLSDEIARRGATARWAKDPAAPKRTSRIVANEIADATDTDVLLYNGPIQRGLDSVIIDMCGESLRPRRTALLILVTEGGNPDAAFRIARCLQERYESYSVFVTGWCKSAGTIIALGASELIVSDHGEMGPLDVQLSRKDELFETQSGLTVLATLKN